MQGADLLQAEELGAAAPGSQEGDSGSDSGSDSGAESGSGAGGSDSGGSQGGPQLQSDGDSEIDTDDGGNHALRQLRGACHAAGDCEQAQPSGSGQETDDARHAGHGSDTAASEAADSATHSEGSGAEGEDSEAASDSDRDEPLSAEESSDGRPRKAVRQKKRPASSQADRRVTAALPARACRLP